MLNDEVEKEKIVYLCINKITQVYVLIQKNVYICINTKYVDVCINLKNLYTILKNTYIRFEKYDIRYICT